MLGNSRSWKKKGSFKRSISETKKEQKLLENSFKLLNKPRNKDADEEARGLRSKCAALEANMIWWHSLLEASKKIKESLSDSSSESFETVLNAHLTSAQSIPGVAKILPKWKRVLAFTAKVGIYGGTMWLPPVFQQLAKLGTNVWENKEAIEKWFTRNRNPQNLVEEDRASLLQQFTKEKESCAAFPELVVEQLEAKLSNSTDVQVWDALQSSNIIHKTDKDIPVIAACENAYTIRKVLRTKIATQDASDTRQVAHPDPPLSGTDAYVDTLYQDKEKKKLQAKRECTHVIQQHPLLAHLNGMVNDEKDFWFDGPTNADSHLVSFKQAEYEAQLQSLVPGDETLKNVVKAKNEKNYKQAKQQAKELAEKQEYRCFQMHAAMQLTNAALGNQNKEESLPTENTNKKGGLAQKVASKTLQAVDFVTKMKVFGVEVKEIAGQTKMFAGLQKISNALAGFQDSVRANLERIAAVEMRRQSLERMHEENSEGDETSEEASLPFTTTTPHWNANVYEHFQQVQSTCTRYDELAALKDGDWKEMWKPVLGAIAIAKVPKSLKAAKLPMCESVFKWTENINIY